MIILSNEKWAKDVRQTIIVNMEKCIIIDQIDKAGLDQKLLLILRGL